MKISVILSVTVMMTDFYVASITKSDEVANPKPNWKKVALTSLLLSQGSSKPIGSNIQHAQVDLLPKVPQIFSKPSDQLSVVDGGKSQSQGQDQILERDQSKNGLEKRIFLREEYIWRPTGNELNTLIENQLNQNPIEDSNQAAISVQTRLFETLLGENDFLLTVSRQVAKNFIASKQDILREILGYNFSSHYLDGAILTALFDARGNKRLQYWGNIPDFRKNPIIVWNSKWKNFLKDQNIELKTGDIWTQKNEMARFLVHDIDELSEINPFFQEYVNSAEFIPMLLYRRNYREYPSIRISFTFHKDGSITNNWAIADPEIARDERLSEFLRYMENPILIGGETLHGNDMTPMKYWNIKFNDHEITTESLGNLNAITRDQNVEFDVTQHEVEPWREKSYLEKFDSAEYQFFNHPFIFNNHHHHHDHGGLLHSLIHEIADMEVEHNIDYFFEVILHAIQHSKTIHNFKDEVSKASAKAIGDVRKSFQKLQGLRAKEFVSRIDVEMIQKWLTDPDRHISLGQTAALQVVVRDCINHFLTFSKRQQIILVTLATPIAASLASTAPWLLVKFAAIVGTEALMKLAETLSESQSNSLMIGLSLASVVFVSGIDPSSILCTVGEACEIGVIRTLIDYVYREMFYGAPHKFYYSMVRLYSQAPPSFLFQPHIRYVDSEGVTHMWKYTLSEHQARISAPLTVFRYMNNKNNRLPTIPKFGRFG